MKTHILLSLIFLFGLLSGCAEHSSLQDTLDKAETLMENHPDSAYSLLQTVDSDALRTRGGRARYALLYTQAQDKNYIDETNDSLISVALDYYRNRDDIRYRFLSLYYKGRIHYNGDNYLNAMLAYSEAETLVPDLQDDYYAGLLYTQLGNIYRKYYDFSKSLYAYQIAEKYYKVANKNFHRQFAVTDQAAVYRNMNEYIKSDSLLNVILLEAKQVKNHTLIKYVLGSLLMQYVEQERVKEAKQTYNELLSQYGIENKTSDFIHSIIKIHLSEGDIPQAVQMLQKAWSRAKTANDSIACHLAASQVYKAKGLYAKAMQEQETGIWMQNRIVKENLQQPVLTMQRDYLAQELAYQTYKRKMHRLLSIIMIAFIIIIASIGGYILQKRLRKHYRKSLHRRLKLQEAENRQKMEQLWEEAMQRENYIRQHMENLNQEMCQKNEISLRTIRHLQEELNKQGAILHQYKEEHKAWTTLADKDHSKQKDLCITLCRTYFKILDKMYVGFNCVDYVNSKSKYAAINKIITKYEDEYLNKKGYVKLEETINLYMDNVMVNFRTEVQLSEEDHYHIITFLFAGFSGTLIAHLMNTTTNVVYKRKADILKRIKEQSPLHSQLFLTLLSK